MKTAQKGEYWFNTPDSPSLCRGGGNGENHPSQLYAIRKYVTPEMTFLDYGAGSGTTYEALQKNNLSVKEYRGLDMIKKNAEWCNEHFKTDVFEWNPTIHKIDKPDTSWDVVYSRHVVDHMNSFEGAMNEHKRVAKQLVIVVLWVPFSDQPEHEIKNIIDHRGTPDEILYPDEYTNQYSEKRVMEYLNGDSNWELVEITKDVGVEVSGHDIVIVLRRKE